MSDIIENAIPIPVVRLIVENDAGKVLILRRANTRHGKGFWCLPGGKVDYGQTVEEAVRLELKEETALICIESRFLYYQDSLPMNPGGMHCINFYFRCRTEGKVLLNEESSDFLWVSPEELPCYSLAFRNGEGLERYWKG